MAVLSSRTLNSVVVYRGVCNHASDVGARPCFSGSLGWVRSRHESDSFRRSTALGMFGRGYIQLHDVFELLDELRVTRDQGFDQMRFEPILGRFQHRLLQNNADGIG